MPCALAGLSFPSLDHCRTSLPAACQTARWLLFLWNQTIVYHFILYARAYGIVFVQSLHRDGYEIGGVFELAPHRFEIFGFDIERALVAVFLIQYVLEIDTLDAGTIGRVDKFVIRLFALIDGRDFTAAVPVIVRLAHHGQFHARSVADIQIANGKVHIHREQLLRQLSGMVNMAVTWARLFLLAPFPALRYISVPTHVGGKICS